MSAAHVASLQQRLLIVPDCWSYSLNHVKKHQKYRIFEFCSL